jgi:hypothetical protein
MQTEQVEAAEVSAEPAEEETAPPAQPTVTLVPYLLLGEANFEVQLQVVEELTMIEKSEKTISLLLLRFFRQRFL